MRMRSCLIRFNDLSKKKVASPQLLFTNGSAINILLFLFLFLFFLFFGVFVLIVTISNNNKMA